MDATDIRLARMRLSLSSPRKRSEVKQREMELNCDPTYFYAVPAQWYRPMLAGSVPVPRQSKPFTR